MLVFVALCLMWFVVCSVLFCYICGCCVACFVSVLLCCCVFCYLRSCDSFCVLCLCGYLRASGFALLAFVVLVVFVPVSFLLCGYCFIILFVCYDSARLCLCRLFALCMLCCLVWSCFVFCSRVVVLFCCCGCVQLV